VFVGQSYIRKFFYIANIIKLEVPVEVKPKDIFR
jgi:hypothetical protein